MEFCSFVTRFDPMLLFPFVFDRVRLSFDPWSSNPMSFDPLAFNHMSLDPRSL